MNKLNGTQIFVGEPVPYDCYDGHGNLLLKKGLIVDTQRQVDFLLERGLFGQPGAASAVAEAIKPDDRPPTPFELLSHYNNRLKQLFSVLSPEPGADKEPDVSGFQERLLHLAEDLQKLCHLDADAVLGSIHLDSSGRYSVMHPIYRAALCELLAARKAVPEADRLWIIAAALTCDLSMLKLQEDLFRQAEPLQPDQQQAIKAHPMATAKILVSFGVNNGVWMNAVIQHHELLNGKGYPRGLALTDISGAARILKLADMYTAMITPRSYRKAMLSKTAMRDIFLKRGSEIDEELAVYIVKELGVYPPGSFVKLQSGELAIVTHRGANPKAPAVKAVVGPRGAPFDKPVLRKTDIREYEILDVVERDMIVKIDLHKLWGYDTK
jgi:HD-GYP domain-containing protein (c-di-GMP phosphodiesterase class II)